MALSNLDGFAQSRQVARLKQMDKNGDGKLSAEEAGAKLWERLKAFDANEDGFINPTELAASGAGGDKTSQRPGGANAAFAVKSFKGFERTIDPVQSVLTKECQRKTAPRALPAWSRREHPGGEHCGRQPRTIAASLLCHGSSLRWPDCALGHGWIQKQRFASQCDAGVDGSHR